MTVVAAGEGPKGLRLRILSTADLHGHLLPWDYYAARPAPAMGLAQAGALIRRLRAEAPGGAALLLDDGDMLTGSLLADRMAAGRDAAGPHPVVAAMNALGYDAAALGNHDLDLGLGPLREALAEARFPVLCANLLGPGGAPLAAPWAILEREARDGDGGRHRLRVGVLGLAPPQTADWARLALGGAVRGRDMVEAGAEAAAALRAAGADLVVGLCHTGIGVEAGPPGMENAGLPLARAAGIDALVLGHTHRVFPGPGWEGRAGVDAAAGTVGGRPTVQPGFHGSHVGVLDLALARGEGGWCVAGHRARAVPVPPDLAPDPAVAAVAAPGHARLLRRLRRPVGRAEAPLFSHFALVAPDPALALVAAAQADAARALLAGRAEAGLPLLSAAAPFRTGGRGGPGNYVDIAPGPVRLRQAAGLYHHPNTLCVVEVTGATLRDWLERSASVFRRLAPGEAEQPLLDPDFASWNFDAIHGLEWTLDPTREAATDAEGRARPGGGGRVGALTHAGRPVAAADRFLLATNSHRLGQGGGFAAATAARVVLSTALPIRDLVVARLRRTPAGREPRAGWRLAAPPGTAAWFDSGPGALAHLGAVAGRGVEPLGPAPGGFHRFRLRL